MVELARRWDAIAETSSAGAAATQTVLDCTIRHLFLDELGEEAFERYFELMNVPTAPVHRAPRGGFQWRLGPDARK